MVFVLPFRGGTEYKESCTWILPESTYVSFSQDPAVHPHYFTVINLSHEYNYID